MEPIVVILYIVFILSGLVIGSFLEVVIYRIPKKLSIVKPGSFCPQCNRPIFFYDNIPLLSYIILRGRCRNCRSKIPIISPIIEILTSLFFLANYIFFGISLNALSGIILCCILIVVSFIDIEFRIIPNVIVLPFTIVGLILSITGNLGKWWFPLAYCAGAFVFMLIIHLIYPRGMGMGDVKLSLMIGAFLVKNVIVALFFGFLIGAVFGLFLIIKKRKLRQSIPFGPFISLGSVLALFYGDYILKWYTGLL